MNELSKKLESIRLVPVVSLPSVEAALPLAEILLENGLPVIEVTFRTACAADGLAAIRDRFPEMTMLAGTIITPQQVETAVAAGAAAIVSPGFSPGLAACCAVKNLPFLPGVCTPSEVQTAMEVGCSTLKFFPADKMGGVTTLKMFKALYAGTHFMPTGGINLGNMSSYLSLDNVLCCGGTWLCPSAKLAAGNWDEIANTVREAAQALSRHERRK